MAWTLKYLALIKIPELSLLWFLKMLPTKTNPSNHQEVCWPNCSSYGSSKLAGEEKQSLDPLASHGQSRSGMSHLQFMGHLTPKWQVYQMSRQDPHYEGAVSVLACSGPLGLSLPSQPRTSSIPPTPEKSSGWLQSYFSRQSQSERATLGLFSEEVV